MQMQVLNTAAMEGLGKVIPFGAAAFDAARTMEFHSNAPLLRCRAAEDILLDFESGMSLLVLYTAGEPLMFYFDRPVQLFAGTDFSIVPLEPVCSARVYLPNDAPLQSEAAPADLLLASVPLIHITQIYTCFYQESRQNFYFRGERHHPYELTYVDRGSLHNLVNGTDITLPQGEILLIDRDNWHMQYSDEPVSFLTVSFDLSSDLLDSIVNKPFALPSGARSPLNRFLQERLEISTFTYDYLESLLKILLIELLRAGSSHSARSVPMAPTLRAENRIMDEALQIISQRCHTPPSLKELSAAVHVSVPYLCRLFNTHLGIPPGEYITKIRLEECKILLCQGELSMGDIAERMGFSSPQQFSRQFKHYCGFTPSEYSRTHAAR